MAGTAWDDNQMSRTYVPQNILRMPLHRIYTMHSPIKCTTPRIGAHPALPDTGGDQPARQTLIGEKTMETKMENKMEQKMDKKMEK